MYVRELNTTSSCLSSFHLFLSAQVPASLMVSPLHTTVTISLPCCHGRPEILLWTSMAVPRLQMETCSTVIAQIPLALSRVCNVEQHTISLSKHQTASATAPSVTQCKAEQVFSIFVMFGIEVVEYIKYTCLSLSPSGQLPVLRTLLRCN